MCEGDFVDRAENVLAFGMPGGGKSHMICAIGHELVRSISVLFVPTYRLVQRLLVAKLEGGVEVPRDPLPRSLEPEAGDRGVRAMTKTVILETIPDDLTEEGTEEWGGNRAAKSESSEAWRFSGFRCVLCSRRARLLAKGRETAAQGHA